MTVTTVPGLDSHVISSAIERRKMLTAISAVALGSTASSLFTGATAYAGESGTGAMAPSICVFDVNETLLDIEFLSPLFQRLFGDRKVMHEWFNQLILYSDAITLSGPYSTFFTLGEGVMKMLATIHNVSIAFAASNRRRKCTTWWPKS